MGKKYKMPTAQEFIDKKIIYDEKKDPIWDILEKEMKEYAEKGLKPYNIKVDVWLRFLKDLRLYHYCLRLQNEKKLRKEPGPPWYVEFSIIQRLVLANLKSNIHQDLIEDLPLRTTKALGDLGITLKFKKHELMEAMKSSKEDPGIFIWNLYETKYKKAPSELRRSYDMNARLLMSSLVFVDIDECISNLEKIMTFAKPVKPTRTKKTVNVAQPSTPFGVYLQERKPVPLHSNYGSGEETKTELPKLEYKLRLRSKESYTKLIRNHNFLKLRMERNEKEAQTVRECNYKFWEPPESLRNSNPKMAAALEVMRIMKIKPKPRFEAPFKNVQYLVAGVTYIGKRPQYILANVSILSTGFIPINGGISNTLGEPVTIIQGFWKYPKVVKEKCQTTCDCMTKWCGSVLKYLNKSKCTCGHLYDNYVQDPQSRQPGPSKDKQQSFKDKQPSLKHGGPKGEKEKAKVQIPKAIAQERYFYPPSKHGIFWIDKAKIFQLDPLEDFIKDVVVETVLSSNGSSNKLPSLSASEVKVEELVGAVLADLTDTPLMIPHLPLAKKLNSLKEWVRNRVKGRLEPKEYRKLLLKAQRNWLNLKHMDFRERAYRVPFTQTELKNLTWAHRDMIQELFNTLMEDFVSRNQTKQVEQARLFWATMNADTYPSQSFLDAFFTYMSGRMKDTYLINPYSSMLTPKYGAKTCPLRF